MNSPDFSGPGRNDLSRLCPTAQAVFAQLPVRKSRAQKAAFRACVRTQLQAAGWPVATEESGRLVKTRNLVAGDVNTARLIFTAHYDTPAILPFPNFIAPRNLAANGVYVLLVGALLLALITALNLGLRALGVPGAVVRWALPAVCLLLMWLVLAGPANPHNANDNTSGVLTLLQLAHQLPAEARQQVALVFFDNEEKGLLGAAAFRARHGDSPHQTLLNFDCVGQGDTALFVLPKALRRDDALAARLRAAFAPNATGEGPAPLVDASPLTLYPSDQALFARGIGVACLCRAPVLGLYLARLHTPLDTICHQQNILHLAAGGARLVAAWPPAAATAPGKAAASGQPPAGKNA